MSVPMSSDAPALIESTTIDPASGGGSLPPPGPSLNDDLRRRLRRTEWRGHLRAYLLIAPLLIFVLVSFVLPLSTLVYKSFHDPVVPTGLPLTYKALREWGGPRDEVPTEPVYAALANDMKAAKRDGRAAEIASRLNIEASGLRTTFMRAVRRIDSVESGPWKPYFAGVDPAWESPTTWATVRNLADTNHGLFFLSALDLRKSSQGDVVRQPAEQRIYVEVFIRTIGISALVALLCMAFGFAIAYLLAHAGDRTANLLMILVLLPFWTSLLVRTTAWIVLLQKEGVINSMLLGIGAISQPLPMMYNKFGVAVAMTHILLPFAILPMYSVMRQIPPSFVRAARSLGASPTTAFLRVYLPQCAPGVAAGVLLVFIIALGYYITPALVGGAGDQMISYFIADNLTRALNWGLASAMGVLVLAAVLLLYWAYDKLVGVTNMRLG